MQTNVSLWQMNDELDVEVDAVKIPTINRLMTPGVTFYSLCSSSNKLRKRSKELKLLARSSLGKDKETLLTP